jgi:hypothetical protein
VINEFLLFGVKKGSSIDHLTLKRRPFETIEVPAVPLKPNDPSDRTNLTT